MKIRQTVIHFLCGLLGIAALALSSSASAQAPAGPLPAATPQPPKKSTASQQAPPQPQVQPRQTIAGAWKLNREESDDPRKKMQEARSSRSGGGPYGGGRYPGGGWPGGGGRGGYGGRRGGESDQNRDRMEELLRPANSLTLMQKDASEVDLTDDQGRKRVFYTDGRKLQKPKDDKYQEIVARWDDKRLVTDEKGPSGRKITRTFELAPDGTQLYETLHMESGRSGSAVVIRFVYDTSESSAASK